MWFRIPLPRRLDIAYLL